MSRLSVSGADAPDLFDPLAKPGPRTSGSGGRSPQFDECAAAGL